MDVSKPLESLLGPENVKNTIQFAIFYIQMLYKYETSILIYYLCIYLVHFAQFIRKLVKRKSRIKVKR